MNDFSEQKYNPETFKEYLKLRYELDHLDSIATITFHSKGNWVEILRSGKEIFVK